MKFSIRDAADTKCFYGKLISIHTGPILLNKTILVVQISNVAQNILIGNSDIYNFLFKTFFGMVYVYRNKKESLLNTCYSDACSEVCQ
jgi:hypothetical protein